MGAVSRHEDGRRVLTDSLRADLERRHNLTVPEAERLFHLIEAGEDEAQSAEQIKAERKVFRTHIERGYSPESDPLVVAQRRRQEEDAARLAQADRSAPEAGPYGTETPYTEATGTVTRSSDLPGAGRSS